MNKAALLVSQSPSLVLFFLLGLVLMTIVLTLVISQGMAGFKIKLRFKKARLREENARQYLIKHNYKILAEQLTKKSAIRVNGRLMPYQLRADYWARKKRKQVLIEVKSGHKATNPLEPAVRRQLLEYFLIYKPDQIILLDMENKIINQISFPFLEKKGLTLITSLLLALILFFLFSTFFFLGTELITPIFK